MLVQVKNTLKADASAATIFQTLLTSRGINDSTRKLEFLHPPEPTLDYLLPELSLSKATLNKFSTILNRHLQANHDILVFGDYDADGVTATAVLWQALVANGKLRHSTSRILPFIPDRARHGYGLSTAALTDLFNGDAFASTQYPDFAPRLVITVDTGIVAHESVLALREHFGDVIITDHHLPLATLPEASTIVHTTATSGAGVAWVIALSLLGPVANTLLDLAVIGIVGDMMSVTGVNRTLITHGLSALSTSRRPGIVALKKVMGIGDKTLTTYDVSFGLAPRINAAGRIYSPRDALRLLCINDATVALELATKIESHNRDRQDYTDQALASLVNKQHDHKIIVAIGDYHEGVIGLVAGKLVEKFALPAVVMSGKGEVVKGSARSLPGLNITELLRSLPVTYLGLGGHEAAAGFSLSHAQVETFIRVLTEIADATIDPALLVKTEVVDLHLSLPQTTIALAELFDSLTPFGIGNPKPKILLEDLTVLADKPLGSEGKHHKLTVVVGHTTRDVLIFHTPHSHPLKHISRLICQLDINVWRDKRELQLISSYVET